MSLKDAHRCMVDEGELVPIWAFHEDISELFTMLFVSIPIENPDWPFEKLMPLAYSKSKKKYIPQSKYFHLSDKSDYESFERNKKFRVTLTLCATPVKIQDVDLARSITNDCYSWCETLRFFPANGEPDSEYTVKELLLNKDAMERFLNLKL